MLTLDTTTSVSSLPCDACREPVVLAQPHLTVHRHVERHRGGAIDVLNAVVIAVLHLRCGWGLGEPSVLAAEAHPLLADEPIPYVLTDAAAGGSR